MDASNVGTQRGWNIIALHKRFLSGIGEIVCKQKKTKKELRPKRNFNFNFKKVRTFQSNCKIFSFFPTFGSLQIYAMVYGCLKLKCLRTVAFCGDSTSLSLHYLNGILLQRNLGIVLHDLGLVHTLRLRAASLKGNYSIYDV